MKNHNKFILSLLYLMLAIMSSFSVHGDNTKSYVLPNSSQFTFNNNNDGFHHFDGEVSISVKYEVYTHKDYDHLIMMIHPDSKSLMMLPYLTIFDSSRETPENIYISNVKDILPLIINPQILAQVSKSNDVVYGTATLLINKLSGGYECDQLTFSANIKSIDNFKSKYSHKNIKISKGC